MMTWENLDLKCAQTAAVIISRINNASGRKADVEKLTTETSTVLSQHGPYACFLYLASQSAKKGREAIAKPLLWGLYGLLQQKFGLTAAQPSEQALFVLPHVAGLSENLDRLLLAKKMLSQTLTYLRYHAKGLVETQPPPRQASVAGGH